MGLKALAEKIFLTALESIQPETLIKNTINRHGDILRINGGVYHMRNNVYVLGFGKAVYGMASGINSMLKDHIKRGFLSVPYGIDYSSKALHNVRNIQVNPAAKNNLPDQAAMKNAKDIKDIIGSLSPDDIALICISGGGSALLPLPVPEISLEDKLKCIKIVANAGGNIKQLNIVRKKLSQTKGGKLLSPCKTPHVISLIISDIVNDPLDIIASGPTVHDRSTVADCMRVFSELNIETDVPRSVMSYLKSKGEILQEDNHFQYCNNFIVGSNKILVKSACSVAKELGYEPYVVTTELEKDAECVGNILADVSASILTLSPKEETIKKLKQINENLDHNDVSVILQKRKLCLIVAGETTVKVRGNGRGGRNQHLVLTVLKRLRKISLDNSEINLDNFCLLSGGTDGQDGATDAAGAICDGSTINKTLSLGLDIDSYLSNCGSYDFFTANSVLDGLIKTGLTGTNVMDIQIILIDME